MAFPTDSTGAIEGQPVCRRWPARVAFTRRDRTTGTASTDTPSGTYWSSANRDDDDGRLLDQLRHPLRGREVVPGPRDDDAPSHAARPGCCREPEPGLADYWSSRSWPSATVHAHVLAPLPAGPSRASTTARSEFLDRHGRRDAPAEAEASRRT